ADLGRCKPFVNSIRPASCPCASLQNRATLWSVQSRPILRIFENVVSRGGLANRSVKSAPDKPLSVRHGVAELALSNGRGPGGQVPWPAAWEVDCALRRPTHKPKARTPSRSPSAVGGRPWKLASHFA